MKILTAVTLSDELSSNLAPFFTTPVSMGEMDTLQRPRADVMITIFRDFRQFSAKKLAFFSITNVMIINLHNLALVRVKNVNFFAKYFGKNIFF
jgi:hypothetical protein